MEPIKNFEQFLNESKGDDVHDIAADFEKSKIFATGHASELEIEWFIMYHDLSATVGEVIAAIKKQNPSFKVKKGTTPARKELL